MQPIVTRNELTDEWQNGDVEAGREVAILTVEIAKATLGLTMAEHKKLKQLKQENLYGRMTRLQLAFIILGEDTGLEITQQTDASGFDEIRIAAQSR